MGIIYFLAIIGPLIFFHELGHFLAARAFGVKCEEFGIGFGPAFASFQRGETLFTLRILPLGGFVLLLGMQGEENDDDEDAGRSLVDKPIWQRMIISFAGPLANVLLAIPIFMLLGGLVTSKEGTHVGFVADDSPAAHAGLLPGDTIVAVDGRSVLFFEQLQRIIRKNPETELRVTVLRDGAETDLRLTPERVEVRDPIFAIRKREIGQAGFGPFPYRPIVYVDDSDSIAGRAGLQTFDRILRVDGELVPTWLSFEDLLDGASEPMVLDIARPVRGDDAYAAVFVEIPLRIALDPPQDVRHAGISPAHNAIFYVEPGSPADLAGLQAGDRIVRSDGQTVSDVGMLRTRMRNAPDREYQLVVERAGERRVITMTPPEVDVVGEFRSEIKHVMIGFHGRRDTRTNAGIPHVELNGGQRIVNALSSGLFRTIEGLFALIFGVLLMITGQVDSSNLGGPMLIADLANRAGSSGILALLHMGAVISINLAIINLLPVPGLDGGTLVQLSIEAVIRRPLSNRARQIIQYVGIVSIVALMLFAFKNDIERYWVDIANWINS